MKRILIALTALTLVASGGFASLATVQGADHRDSPINQANATADINDVYAFRSATNSNNLVVAISTNPLNVPSDNATRGVYDPTVMYQIHIDRNGDLLDDATANIRITGGPPSLLIEGLGDPIAAPITPARRRSSTHRAKRSSKASPNCCAR